VKTIEIDDEVYVAIERRVESFNQSPNTVLRKVLGIIEKPNPAPSPTLPTTPSLDVFLRSGDYVSAVTADERYLKLISWLLRNHVDLHSRLDGYRMRTRILFAKDPEKIEKTGQSVVVKRVPGIDFPFFAMVTLDNPGKRKIVKRVLALAGYTATAAEQGLATLPDSGITRGENRRLREKYK
jgi:negative regulator of replication initiation